MYLILHKVRGEPAFDVAERMENGWWIIPTSGHRAYPAAWWPFSEVLPGYERHMGRLNLSMFQDHYSINDRKPEPPIQTSTPTRRSLTLDDLD